MFGPALHVTSPFALGCPLLAVDLWVWVWVCVGMRSVEHPLFQQAKLLLYLPVLSPSLSAIKSVIVGTGGFAVGRTSWFDDLEWKRFAAEFDFCLYQKCLIFRMQGWNCATEFWVLGLGMMTTCCSFSSRRISEETWCPAARLQCNCCPPLYLFSLYSRHKRRNVLKSC